MHTIEIPEIKIKTEFASEISELKPAEYIGFMQLLILYCADQIDYKTFRIRLAVMLLDLKANKKKLPAGAIDQVYENIYRLSECLDSFCNVELRDGSPVRVLETYFIKQLLPFIELPDGVFLYGPDDALLNVKALEFKEAHNFFMESENGKNIDALNHLVTILYRPQIENCAEISQREDFDGQRRVKFNPNTVEKRAEMVSALPYHIKYAVWLWFANCEKFFQEGKPTIDGIEIDFSILYKKEDGDSKQPKLGLTDVLFTMAETGLFGKMNETAEQDWYDVLYAMYRMKIQHDELKANTPTQA